MHIRSATSADAPLLGKIYATSFAHAYRRILDPDMIEGFTPERAEQQIRRSMKAGARIWAAVHKRDGVIGFISVIRSDASLPGYAHEIEAHYVLPEFHSRGVGRGVLLHAAAETKAPLAVWVPTRLSACRFYEHLGAQSLGNRGTTVQSKPLEATAFGWTELPS